MKILASCFKEVELPISIILENGKEVVLMLDVD
jgi:hypothetical protein